MGDTWILIVLVVVGVYIYRLNNDVKDLKHKLFTLSSMISALDSKLEYHLSALKGFAPPDVKDQTVAEPQVLPETETSPQAEEKRPEPPKESFDALREAKAAPTQKASVYPQSSTLDSVEKDLSTRWMMWVGGIAFALGGAFFVKYSIDSGLLSPVVRVILGVILGLVMVASGETLRLKRQSITWLDGTPDYLPSAISAAGLFTAFAAIYASYALYGLIPPLLAFFALALLSFLASALALVQGRFFAYIGLIGGLIVPALVSTGNPSAYKLFPYLLIIVASGLWVSRKRSWIDVPATAVFLAIFWVFLWIFTNWHVGDIIPVGAYLLILGAANSISLRGATPERATNNSLAALMPQHVITIVSDLATLMCVILFVSIIRLEHYSAIALFMGALGLGFQAYLVSRSAENDTAGLISIFGALFLLVTWHVPDMFEVQQMLNESEPLYFALAPIAPPGMEMFVTVSVLLAGALSIGIFLWLPNLLRKSLWASISVAVPVGILIINYWRIQNLDTSIPFAFIALGLAGLITYATIRLNRSDIEGRTNLVAAYAAGATAAVALAIAMVLRDAWLSFALALEVLALGYIWRATAVKGLRYFALLLASIVLVRLFLNASIIDYGGYEPLPLINWLFYAYGLSAAIFYYAAKMFAQEERDRLLSVLTAGSIMLLISFITLEIHVLFGKGGTLKSEPSDIELALQTINWSAATALLMWRELKDNDKLLGYLRRFMTLLSLFGLIVGGVGMNNVFDGRFDYDVMPIFNIQLLQFFIPALLYAIKAWLAHRGERSRSLNYYGGLAFFIMWYWITAEVHTAATLMDNSQSISDWESYSYSIAWLAYAIIILVAGLLKNMGKLRMAGLAVLGVVVLKVFLIDMGDLEGLARALSFMGLGAALIGIGYLYQKLKQDAPDEVEEGTP